MDRADKKQLVETLGQDFSKAGAVVVAHYAGLTVAQMSDLRNRMRAVNGKVKVAKNTLVKIALKGTPAEGVSDLLKGMTVMLYSDEVTTAPKIATVFAKERDKFQILGGTMGDKVLSADGVKALGSLPSLNELRGQLIGLIQAPAAKVARVFKAYADKDETDAA